MANCKVTAIANQKGGTGKTTTAVQLGIGLAAYGERVLLIDADPQGDLTTSLGWSGDELPVSLANHMEAVIRDDELDPHLGMLRHDEGVDLIPANIELAGIETALVNAMSREYTLKSYLSELKGEYDRIIIDCMPSLGMLTINALAAADSVIIPVQAQYLPLKGMTQLVKTINRVKRQINKSTGEPFLVDGEKAVSTLEFVPDKTSGEITVTFIFDAHAITSETDLVVFETLTFDDYEIAAHTDLEDVNQTVNLIPIEDDDIPKIPQTGDRFNGFVWITMMGMSVLGMALLGTRKKKNNIK